MSAGTGLSFVTHITRYFMTIPGSARLVLQAAALGESKQALGWLARAQAAYNVLSQRALLHDLVPEFRNAGH